MNEAIEVVIFRAKAGDSPEQLQLAATAIEPFLSMLPDFISREYGAPANCQSQYIDIVYWRDRCAVKPAPQESVESVAPIRGQYFDSTEPDQTQILHIYRVA